MAENYLLLDTTLNMIAIRLGDILLRANDMEFASEVAALDNYDDWITSGEVSVVPEPARGT